MGSAIGRIKANDADEGVNAETEYKISNGDEHDMFQIITDMETQEGVIIVKKVIWKGIKGARDIFSHTIR